MSDELDFDLTLGEQAELDDLERDYAQIDDGMMRGACILLKIKEGRLWRSKYKSFKDYCEQRWGLTRQRIYQMMEAYEVVGSLPDDLASLITNEGQVRALSKSPPGKRGSALRIAASRGPVTAAAIEKAADEQSKPRSIAPRIERKHEYDDVGTPIPDDAMPFWKRRQEAQDLLTAVTKIKSTVTERKNVNDPFFMRISNSVIYDLQTVYQHLLECKPYAVCTTCQGTPSLQPQGCNFCKNTGLISKHQWDTQSLEEVKAMRIKDNNRRNGSDATRPQ